MLQNDLQGLLKCDRVVKTKPHVSDSVSLGRALECSCPASSQEMLMLWSEEQFDDHRWGHTQESESRERREHGDDPWLGSEKPHWGDLENYWKTWYSGAHLLFSGWNFSVPCPDYKTCKGKRWSLLLSTSSPVLEQSRNSVIPCFLFLWDKHGRSCPFDRLSMFIYNTNWKSRLRVSWHRPHSPAQLAQKPCNGKTLNTYPAITK